MTLQHQSMEVKPSSSFGFPPGFRFHPSDEELITYYLENKAYSRPLPASIIAEIDLYKYNPWDLPNKALFGRDEWYFFTPRDRKYPNGARPNRAAGSGFWKATGTDRPITSASKSIGLKKALVFYAGRPPKGVKTDWIMDEYRLPDSTIKPLRKKGSMRLDDWVLCRVRQKNSMPKTTCGSGGCSPSEELVMSLPRTQEGYPRYTNWDTDINMDCLNEDGRLLASALSGQALLPIENISSVSFQGSNSFPLAYDRGSSQLLDSPITVSSCNNHTQLKRKPSAEDGYDGILPSDELNSGNKNKDIYLSKTPLDNELNYHSQVQSLEGFYSANPWDPATSFVELNQLAFAGNIYNTHYSDGYISHR